MTLFAALGCVMLLVGIVARIAIAHAASSGAVDQHYWLLAARAYRDQTGLPVRITGKYLMEDETQAYPPLFGITLGRLTGKWTEKILTQIIGVVEFTFLAGLLLALDAPWEMQLAALGCYAIAPVLVVYNAQLTPRILGDFFLVSAMALQVAAVVPGASPPLQWICWGGSACMLALMVMTHKMTLQLHLVLLPLWWWALGAWQVPVATAAGFAIYIILVGSRFAQYQFRAHWDIVTFWNRHWRNLGANQFAHSPLYGDPEFDRRSCFHAPGWRGRLKHLRIVASYAPLVLVLPVCSVLSGSWPPPWVLTWLGGVYCWALLTLFVNPLKCLGGGHLYIFNAIVPASVYIVYLPPTSVVGVLLVVGTILTVLSLGMAWKVIGNRPIIIGDDLDEAIRHIGNLPKANFAIFPLQSSESIAARTHHAVLWGGHGFGFANLEGFYPVLTKPLSTYFDRYRVDWVLWNSDFWPKGEVRMSDEEIIEISAITKFGKWRLAPTKRLNE